MTLANGAPGAARPGEGDGPWRGPGTPQSGIPTQGPPPANLGPMPPRPSGPFPAPPTPPPAQRSPLHDVDPLRRPDDDRTALVKPPSTAGGWTKARAQLQRRGPVRYGVIGVLALALAFVLFSAVMWWVGPSAPSATATVAPVTWTGIVHDVGAAGVNLRSAAQVRPDDARDTAARGARLALSCGETGDVVARGPVKTATWLKTTDGLFVSMLYVRVDGHTSIPSCDGSKVDGPLVALADPANPTLPPPPGTQLAADGTTSSRPGSVGQSQSTLADGSGVPLAPQPGAAGAPAAAAPPAAAPANGVGTGSAKVGTGQASAASPPIATGTATATLPPKAGGGTSTGGTTTGSGTGEGGSAASAHIPHVAPNPDVTPVG
jgi:hypothetical protein